MKRFRIWISSFTLVQQFLTIVFITFTVLIFFIFAFLNKNVDSFTNTQMYVYIHRSQNEYLETRVNYKESNVVHFVYSTTSKRYLNTLTEEYADLLSNIDPDPEGGNIDGRFSYENNSIIYSIISFDEDYRLVSIIKNNFRDEFRNALYSGVVNITFYVVGGLIALILSYILFSGQSVIDSLRLRRFSDSGSRQRGSGLPAAQRTRRSRARVIAT